MISREERQNLREAVRDVKVFESAFADQPMFGWELQTSNSFRRIGQHGDGNVLRATNHPIDGHPDLSAAPGVLDYIVAAQPRVVTALLDALDAAEDKLIKAREISDKLVDVERRIDEVAGVLSSLASAVTQIAGTSDPKTVAKAHDLINQLVASLRDGTRG